MNNSYIRGILSANYTTEYSFAIINRQDKKDAENIIIINKQSDNKLEDILVMLIKNKMHNATCGENMLLLLYSQIEEPLYYVKYTDKLYTRSELVSNPDVKIPTEMFDKIDFRINGDRFIIFGVIVYVPNYKFDKLLHMLTFCENNEVNDKYKSQFNKVILTLIKNIK